MLVRYFERAGVSVNDSERGRVSVGEGFREGWSNYH